MSAWDELCALLGEPAGRQRAPDDWDDVERYVGSALPGDFTSFLDTYGTGQVTGELTVLHPRGPSPLLERMRTGHETFTGLRRRALAAGRAESYPYPFHPEPGGLIWWGRDQDGHEYFFLPRDPHPDRWTVVTMLHEEGCETFDGPFSAFALAFVRRLLDVDPYEGLDPAALDFLEPEGLEELVATGEIGPVQPRFEPV